MSTLNAIADSWFLKAIEIYPETARGSMMQTGDRFRNPVASTLRESLAILVKELAGGMKEEQVAPALDAIVRVRAVQDCTPEQALEFPVIVGTGKGSTVTGNAAETVPLPQVVEKTVG